MLAKTEALVLRSFRYGETKMIVSMFTREHGRVSFIMSLPKTPRGRLKKQYFQPMTLLQIECDVRPQQELQKLHDAAILTPLPSLMGNPQKLAIALFVAEFLYYALRSEQCNKPLFDYVRSAIEWLDGCESSFANFHLVLLMHLSRFLGFYPNMGSLTPNPSRGENMGSLTPNSSRGENMGSLTPSPSRGENTGSLTPSPSRGERGVYSSANDSEAIRISNYSPLLARGAGGEALYFDLQAATFCATPPLHRNFLMPQEAQMLRLMMRMDLPNMHLFRLNRQQRNRCVEVALLFYRLHLPDFPELRSTEVLRELWA